MPYSYKHYLIPLLAMSLAIFSQYSGFDLWLAGHFYDQQQHLWPYQEHWLWQTIIHRGGRDLVGVFVIVTLLLFITSFVVKQWRHLRVRTGYVLTAVLTSLLIIGQLKSHTHIYSPWDLKQFGGSFAHIRLFDHVVQNTPVGYAFPAGHAGGGYMLFSLYFLLRETAPKYRYVFLTIATVVGMTFGIAQQLRGAHMLSHDLTAITICWLSCIVWGKIFFKSVMQTSVPSAASFRDIVVSRVTSPSG